MGGEEEVIGRGRKMGKGRLGGLLSGFLRGKHADGSMDGCFLIHELSE